MTEPIELSGLDGTNPLGVLAALGTLVTLENMGESARLSWRRRDTWVPAIEGLSASTRSEISAVVARGLEGDELLEDVEQQRVEAQKRYERARQAAHRKRSEVAKRSVSKSDREAALDAELAPLERERDAAREKWLEALSEAVPRRELALGKTIDCTPAEYQELALLLRDAVAPDTSNLLAAFGTDACLEERRDAIEATPFCFINGSGHQYFLDTARQLIERVSVERVERALFDPWTYRDPKLSMRWDPLEDRRYAFLDQDPSKQDARTVWMANLLAYEALALFPCAPRRRLRATGWTMLEREPVFTWPLWEFPANGDTIRSLLQLRELTAAEPDLATLRARGVSAVFRARRIRVGTGANVKINFSPARAAM